MFANQTLQYGRLKELSASSMGSKKRFLFTMLDDNEEIVFKDFPFRSIGYCSHILKKNSHVSLKIVDLETLMLPGVV